MGWLKKLLGKAGRERAAALVAEGVSEAHAGRLEEAAARYAAAVDADPDYALAHLNLALARMDLYNAASTTLSAEDRRARLLEIESSLERALALDASLLGGWRCLGHVAARLGHDPRAEEAFTHLLEVAPEDFPHRAEARASLAEVAPRARRARAVEDVLRLAMDEEAPSDALQSGIDGLAPFVDDPELPLAAHAARGALLRRLGRSDEAQAAYEACLAKDAGHVEARRALATLHLQAGDLKRALEHSVEAYRADPNDAGLVCNVGVCWLGLGDVEKAAEYIEIARGLAPKDPIVQRAWSALEAARQPTRA